MRWRICSLDIEHLWCVIQHRYIGADVQCAIKVDLQHECNAVVRVRWRPVGRDVIDADVRSSDKAFSGAICVWWSTGIVFTRRHKYDSVGINGWPVKVERSYAVEGGQCTRMLCDIILSHERFGFLVLRFRVFSLLSKSMLEMNRPILCFLISDKFKLWTLRR